MRAPANQPHQSRPQQCQSLQPQVVLNCRSCRLLLIVFRVDQMFPSQRGSAQTNSTPTGMDKCDLIGEINLYQGMGGSQSNRESRICGMSETTETRGTSEMERTRETLGTIEPLTAVLAKTDHETSLVPIDAPTMASRGLVVGGPPREIGLLDLSRDGAITAQHLNAILASPGTPGTAHSPRALDHRT